MKGNKNVTYLSLGSNIGDRKKYLEKAKELLQLSENEIIKTSSIYETSAWGFRAEKAFYNIVLELRTTRSPIQLLYLIKSIEKKIGSVHNSIEEGYSSRKIDIDIVSYNNVVYFSDKLNIPHLLAHKRRFVLIPLMELNPIWNHPFLGERIKSLINKIEDDSYIKKIE